MRRRLAVLVLAVSACVGVVVPTSAQSVVQSQDVLSTSWAQPNPEAGVNDGLGTWVYVAPEASVAYEFPLTFAFDHLRTGAVTLGRSANGNVARLSLRDPLTGPVASAEIPYGWSPGRFYSLYVHQLTADNWGAWVMDWDAGTWAYVGSVLAPAGWGQLVKGSLTSVQWSATATRPGTCTGGPGTDAYFFPPLGYTASQFTFSTLSGQNAPAPGTCPAQAEILANGWVHYHLGG